MEASKESVILELVCMGEQLDLSSFYKAYRTGMIKDSNLEYAQKYFEKIY